LAAHVTSEVIELLLCEATFHESPRVNSGGGVSLEVNQIAAVLGARGMPEMIEADAKQGADRGKAGDVPPQFVFAPIGAHDHR
jgi:hypothetical protein